MKNSTNLERIPWTECSKRLTQEPTSEYFSGWAGHKGRVALDLLEWVPEHQGWAEPCVGLPSLLQRKLPSGIELINDLDMGLTCALYSLTQPKLRDLLIQSMMNFRRSQGSYEMYQSKRLEYSAWANEEGLRLPDLDDMQIFQWATAFMFVLKYSYSKIMRGGKKSKLHFDYGEFRPVNYSFNEETLNRFAQRLRYTQISQLDWETFLSKSEINQKNWFWFVDPPYVGVKKLYATDTFTMEVHERLAIVLENTQAQWMLTYKDDPWVRDRYEKMDGVLIHEKEYFYTINNNMDDRGNRTELELILTNYDPLKIRKWRKKRRRSF